MGVDDARRFILSPDKGKASSGKENKSLSVVEIIALVFIIILTAVKIFAPVQKINGYAFVFGGEDIHGGGIPWIAYMEVFHGQPNLGFPRAQAPIKRGEHSRGNAHFRQGRGQSAHDVAQAAALGKRIHFRRSKIHGTGHESLLPFRFRKKRDILV